MTSTNHNISKQNSPKSNRTKKTIIWSLALLILIVNTPPAQFFLQEDYSYRNKAGTFQYSEEGGKGKSFEGALRKYQYFLNENPEQQDITLYRTFTIKWWLPWNWYQLLFHNQRFRLPYYPEPK